MTREDLLLEIAEILNRPGITWKIRRALLVHKIGLSWEQARELVKEDDPSDY